MARLYLPATAPEDGARLLGGAAGPAEGPPALDALARAWQGAEGLPPEVASVFASSEALPELEPLLALPAHAAPPAGDAGPEPLDLWLLARTPEELVSVAVEAKGAAPFGARASRARPEAPREERERVERLCAELGLAAPAPDSALFHLLQRTAGALLEARRFHAAHAVLLVHAFDEGDGGFDDFAQLVSLFGQTSEPGRLVTVGRPGVSLHFGWARGASRAAG